MRIINSPPFATSFIIWQEQPGQWTLTLVCKATYSLEPGIAVVATEPDEINEQDNHWDDDPQKSVYAPSDLAPYKHNAEVLLVGSAYAPRGEPVRSLFARIVVGQFDKSIEVYGQRTRSPDGSLVEGPRWTQMSLRYERAAGGESSWNPVGVDSSVMDAYGRRSLPNLQPPAFPDLDGGATIPAVGYGPVAARWPMRQEKLGALRDVFADGRWTETPLGLDFDGSYFQSAPLDQFVPVIRADEMIVLEHLHPTKERLVTRLPGIKPRTRVEIEGLPPWELMLVADTLWIDTNRAVCTATFRGQLPLDGRDQPGTIYIGVEYPGKPVHFPDAPQHAPMSSVVDPETSDVVDDFDLTHTTSNALGALEGERPTALPFAAPKAHTLPWNPAAQPPPSSPPRPTLPAKDPDGRETGVYQVPVGAGRMPMWLDKAPGKTISAATAPNTPPGARGAPVAPPPVVQMLRPPEVAPTGLAMASHRAAGVEGLPPPPPTRNVLPTLPGVIAPPAIGAPVPPISATGAGTTLGQAAVLAASMALPEDKEDKRPAADKPLAPAAGAAHGRTVVDLLWFDPALPPRLEENATWKKILDGEPVEEKPKTDADGFLEPDLSRPQKKPAPKPAEKTPEQKAKEDKSRVSKVVSRATTTADVENALYSAINDDGVLESPLCVVGGELELPFDEVETLKVLVSATTPLAASDKKLKDTLDFANETLGTPLGQSPEVAANLSLRIREAWAKANRMLPQDYLDVHSRRVLLEQRKYQMRELVGAQWIRAVMHGVSGDKPIPTYLPADLSKKLPLFTRFPARLIVEVLAQQDQSEGHPIALRVHALGRVISAWSKR